MWSLVSICDSRTVKVGVGQNKQCSSADHGCVLIDTEEDETPAGDEGNLHHFTQDSG